MPGRTWSWDAMTLSARDYLGRKYAVGGRDERSGFMDAFYMEARDESIDGMIECILKLRNDPAMGEYRHLICSVIFLDPAGEWSEKFKAGIDKLKDIGVLVIHRATNADKRQQALAEVTMRIMEVNMRKIMIDTRLETEAWSLAMSHGIWVANRLCTTRDQSRAGHGPRPLEIISCNHYDRNECDRQLWWSLSPGKLC